MCVYIDIHICICVYIYMSLLVWPMPYCLCPITYCSGQLVAEACSCLYGQGLAKVRDVVASAIALHETTPTSWISDTAYTTPLAAAEGVLSSTGPMAA